MMTDPFNADPLRIESALASPRGLSVRLIGVGDRIRGAMDDQQPGVGGDQVAVAMLPPRRKRYHGADAATSGQVRGDTATHRMANECNVLRFASPRNVLEDPFRVAHRIHARTVPSAKPVLHLPHVHSGTQSTLQRTRDEFHSHIRQLPPPGRLLATDPAAWQH
jgi:hypothetical protein